MVFLLTKLAPDPGGFSAQLCPSCLSPLGTGPQVPVSQVQKSSGGSISWLGVTCQLYHQLDTCRATCGAATCRGHLTLWRAARSPQWNFSPGGMHTPFLELLASTTRAMWTRTQRRKVVYFLFMICLIMYSKFLSIVTEDLMLQIKVASSSSLRREVFLLHHWHQPYNRYHMCLWTEDKLSRYIVSRECDVH